MLQKNQSIVRLENLPIEQDLISQIRVIEKIVGINDTEYAVYALRVLTQMMLENPQMIRPISRR